jgi:MFS family permease
VGQLGGVAQRRQAFALNRLAVNLGMGLGPALGGVLATFSFPLLFWVDGATSLLATIVLFARTIESPRRLTPAPQAARMKGMANLLPDARMGYFLFAMLPSLFVFFQDLGAYPLFLVNELHLPDAFYGGTFTLNTLLIVIFQMRVNEAASSWPVRRALAFGAALFAIGFGAHLVTHSALPVLCAVVVWTAGEMILFPTASAYVADMAPRGRSGEYMGLYSMVIGFSTALGPALGIMVLGRWGSGALWGGALALGLLGAAILARVETLPAESETLSPAGDT